MNIHNRQSGTSLLEVVVAMVVFAVGIIGIASMLLTSMRNNDATLLRTQSTMLASEVYEMMLANLPAAEACNYGLSMNAELGLAVGHNCSGASADCTPAQVAAWDLAQWGARTQQMLAKADAAISVDTTTDPIAIQVSLRYKPLLETQGNTTETFDFRARE